MQNWNMWHFVSIMMLIWLDCQGYRITYLLFGIGKLEQNYNLNQQIFMYLYIKIKPNMLKDSQRFISNVLIFLLLSISAFLGSNKFEFLSKCWIEVLQISHDRNFRWSIGNFEIFFKVNYFL